MTPQDFCYWLNGYFELEGQNFALNQRQIQIVKDRLKLVLDKKTPDRNNQYSYTTPTPNSTEGKNDTFPIKVPNANEAHVYFPEHAPSC